MRNLIVFVVLLCSCAAVNQNFVKSVDGYSRVILMEYKMYVEKDTSLSEATKKIRLQSADQFQKMVDEAKE